MTIPPACKQATSCNSVGYQCTACKFLPELITTRGDDGYKTVTYAKLTGILIAAVKELKAEADSYCGLCHSRRIPLAMSPRMRHQSCAALAIDLYRAMKMTFWLPQGEAALGREAGQQEHDKQAEGHCTGPKSRYEDSSVREACYTRKPLIRIGEHPIT